MKNRTLKSALSVLLSILLIIPSNAYGSGAIGDGFGGSDHVIPGNSSEGVVNVTDSALIRVSVLMDTDSGFQNGYEDRYPANDTYGILLGAEGNKIKSNKVLTPQTGSLGKWYETDNIYYGNYFSDDRRGRLAAAVWALFMEGKSGEYTGAFTQWMPSDNTIHWDQLVRGEDFTDLGLTDTSILTQSSGIARLSKDNRQLKTEQENIEMNVTGLIIAAYMKERGQEIDLDEVLGSMTGKNDKRLVICLENLYAFNEVYDNPDNGWVYMLPWHLMQLVANRRLPYSMLSGTTSQVSKNVFRNQANKNVFELQYFCFNSHLSQKNYRQKPR